MNYPHSSCPLPSQFPVLIVDDDPVAQAMLEAQLQAAGYSVYIADNAQRAMELLRAHKPRIVILDWIMPEMDGLQLCRIIRSMKDAPLMYVIMLTQRSEKSELVEAFVGGVDDFLCKPFDAGELIVRLRAGCRVLDLASNLQERVQLTEQLNAQLSQLNRELTKVAATDELTGLINRREAMARLKDLWQLSRRHGHPLSCAMIDLDSFKAINDTIGHLNGDQVLRRTAQLLRETLRDTDVICRLGGDEFLILFPHSSAAQAQESVQRCREKFANHNFDFNGLQIAPTLSAGVAQRRDTDETMEQMLQAADAALYAAKTLGRNAVHFAA